VPDSPDFDIGAGDMTIEAWFNPESSSFTGMMNHTNGMSSSDGWWIFSANTTGVRFCMNDVDHDVWQEDLFPTGEWTHVAIVKAGSAISFYFDGSYFNSIDYGQHVNDSSSPFEIGLEGSTYGNWYFTGTIDEVLFWNVARTEAEIQQDMEL
jgi:hypothetical protein